MKKRELSSVQKSIMMLEKFHENSNINNIVSSMVYEGIIDSEIINRAYDIVVNKNPLMRTRYIEKNGNLEIVEMPYQKHDMKVTDLRNTTKEVVEEYIDQIIKEKIPLDGILIFGEIIYLPSGKTMLLNKAHHIVGDAWSIVSIQSNQIVELIYKQIKKEEINEEDYISPDYDIFINREKEYKKQDKYKEDKEYFKKLLENSPKCLSIKNGLKERTYEAERVTKYVEGKFLEDIRKYCKENNISEYSLFLAALTAYLYKVNQKEDILLGTPILNRLNREEKKTQGLFVSALPLRFKIEEKMTFLELVKYISAQMFASYRHIKCPLSDILEQYYKNSDEKKIFDISLSYQNTPYKGSIAENNVECTWYCNKYQQESLIMHIMSLEKVARLTLHYDFLTSLISKNEIQYIHSRISEIIKNGISKNSKLVDLEYIPKEELKEIEKYSFKKEKINWNEKETIISAFLENVNKYPDKVAVKYKEEEMTYLQLSRKVNALAVALRKRGVANNSIVAIKLDRGIDQIIAILAVLKAGGAYMPIHEKWPEERILYMLEDSKAVCAITTKENVEVFACLNEYQSNMLGRDLVIDIEEYFNNVNIREIEDIKEISKPEDVAYIIYTSGTTGNPKGTLVTNKNVIVLLKTRPFPLEITKEDIWSLFHAYTFDVSVWEIFGAILSGGKLIIIPEEAIVDAEKYVDILKKEKVTIFNQTPSMLYNVIEADKLSKEKLSARYATIGGERLHTTKLKEFHEKYNDLQIYIAYGMTETTVVTTLYKLKEEDYEKDISFIGTPLPLRYIHILDKNNKILPLEIEGELSETGLAVSNGYLNKEKLTKEKFIENKITNEKTYKSGDIAKIDLEGNIVLIGRKDNQVKIRGYRIELEEIEKSLVKIEGVSKVLVHAKNQRIFAFIERKKTGKKILKKYIKKSITETLPSYMFPEIYIVDDFKYTINGKIDINHLMDLVKEEKENKKIKLPETKEEKEITDIFKKELNESIIGIDEEFKNMNIDSLEILKISIELKKIGYMISPQDIYTAESIEILAKQCAKLNKTELVEMQNNKLEKNNIARKTKKCDFTNILLTGATGFLGINILHDLIKDASVKKVYCLVRNARDITAKDKLKKEYYRIFKEEKEDFNNKIEYVVGDITKEDFAIGDKLNTLRENITTVINCAASTKYYGDYKEKYETNVGSVENIINFAKEKNISICHISTLSVAGFTKKDSKEVFSEDVLDIGQSFLDNIYMSTKFKAEEKLIEVSDKINIKIFRLGNLMPRTDSGKFQKNERDNTFMNIINSVVKNKYIAKEVKEMYFDITPVDKVADIVCMLSKEDTSTNVYHVANNYISLGKILDLTSYEKEEKSLQDYVEHLRENEDDLMEIMINKNLAGNFKIKTADLSKTLEILNTFDIKWKQVDENYINKILNIVERW